MREEGVTRRGGMRSGQPLSVEGMCAMGVPGEEAARSCLLATGVVSVIPGEEEGGGGCLQLVDGVCVKGMSQVREQEGAASWQQG